MKARSYNWRLVYATPDGALHEAPDLHATGASAFQNIPLRRMIPLPAGSTLTMLPGCRATPKEHEAGRDDRFAVGALLPTGYSRLLTPSYEKMPGAPHVPLFGYTAIAALHGKLFAAALPLDPGGSWDPAIHNTLDLPDLVAERLDASPDNRLLRHHAHCALDYGCYTAQNLFYRRHEMAIAVSGTCNAQCVGCISEQLEDVTAPHDRIGFVPTVDEIVDVAVPHLANAPEPIVSFGQGCEGEPLMRARLIARAISEIRRRTGRGQIHINTNGSSARALPHLIDAGLDSVRVSMFSAVDRNHAAYYGPRGYDLGDMRECLLVAGAYGLHTSINLLTYPGFNDSPSEVVALVDFLRDSQVQMVQIRTLNMDRELLEEKVGFPAEPGVGIESLLLTLRSEIPGIRLGSRTPYVGRARAYVS